MRALVKRGPSSGFHLQEVAAPSPAEDELLIQVRATGVCGTDLHILRDEYPHADPLVPGHELVGEVVEAADGWEAGERVVAELHTGACRRCALCTSGAVHVCPFKRAYGTWRDGAFAELIALPGWLLHRAPEGVPDEVATLVEPTACAAHGLFDRGGFEPGQTVFVAGHGPIGLLAARLALHSGAARVIVSGTTRRGTARLDAARALGAETIDVTDESAAERVAELTGGDGVDLALETAGTPEALADAVGAARRTGRVAVLGVSPSPEAAFPWADALVKDLDVAFSFSSRGSDWERALALARETELDSLVTHVVGLDAWADALDAIESGAAVKVVLKP